MNCSKCGAAITTQVTACPSCGAPFTESELDRLARDLAQATKKVIDTGVSLFGRAMRAVEPTVDRAAKAVKPAWDEAAKVVKPVAQTTIKVTREVAEKTVKAAKPALEKVASASEEAARKVKEKMRKR